MDQSHHNLQLDALRELYRKHLSELNSLRVTEVDTKNIVDRLRKDIEKNSQVMDGLQQHMYSKSLLIENARVNVSFEQDYIQRQTYYTAHKIDLNNEYGELLQEWHRYKGIIVSPEGPPTQYERSASLLSELAKEGFLCLQFNLETEGNLEFISDGSYKYKNELLLLNWLTTQHIMPVILCTSVHQSAWFDLIDEKSIWYDISNLEDYLLGEDASARLKHYNLIKIAALITYSNLKWKKSIWGRKDAIFLDSNQTNYLDSILNYLHEVHKIC